MTEFERITQSPETVGAFLASLPCIDGPWDTEFHKRYCSACLEPECDRCPNEVFRGNPGWWLALKAGDDRAAAKPSKYGINGGRVSKLEIKKRTMPADNHFVLKKCNLDVPNGAY